MEASIIRGDLHIFRLGSGAREELRCRYFSLSALAKWSNRATWSRKSDVKAGQEYNFQDNRGIWYMRVNRVLGSAPAFLSRGSRETGLKMGEDALPPGFIHEADIGLISLSTLHDWFQACHFIHTLPSRTPVHEPLGSCPAPGAEFSLTQGHWNPVRRSSHMQQNPPAASAHSSVTLFPSQWGD